jgi:DNA-binding FadR family transcriptional regulator
MSRARHKRHLRGSSIRRHASHADIVLDGGVSLLYTSQMARIYERIAGSITRQIEQGRLVPGDKLPSERDMARRHKVSRVAVREAYRSLEERGVVSVRRGARGGTTILQPANAAAAPGLSGGTGLDAVSLREICRAHRALLAAIEQRDERLAHELAQMHVNSLQLVVAADLRSRRRGRRAPVRRQADNAA